MAAPWRPEPRLRGGRWYVDLRSAGGGQHRLTAPSDDPTEALHQAYAHLLAVKAPDVAARAAGAPLAADAPTIERLIEMWRPVLAEERLSPANQKYYDSNLRMLAAELGQTRVSVFEPPHGDTLLVAYRNRLADHPYKPRLRRNRLQVLFRLFRFAKKRGWLAELPENPSPTVGAEVLNDPVYETYSEADFRALRDGLWAPDEPVPRRWRNRFRDAAAWEHFKAQRRLYLSVAYYTGMHTADLDALTNASLDPEAGTFLRHNQKSAQALKNEVEAKLRMPEQLQLDALAELERLGRYWRPKEAIAGGLWDHPTQAINNATKRLGLPHFNFRLCRRSVAETLCLLGWSVRECAEYLGHVDDTMVTTVYTRWKLDRSPVRLDWTIANVAAVRKRLDGSRKRVSFAGHVEGPRHGPHQAPAPAGARAERKANDG